MAADLSGESPRQTDRLIFQIRTAGYPGQTEKIQKSNGVTGWNRSVVDVLLAKK